MKKAGFTRRVLTPILLTAGVMLLSTKAYDYSRSIEDANIHRIAANISAVLMFLSIWLGAFFANILAWSRGASFTERLFVCLFTPVLWSSQVLADFSGIYSREEFLFLIFHNIILGCPIVALFLMGLTDILCGVVYRIKSGDYSVPMVTGGSVLVFLFGAGMTTLMLWNGGHFYYYLYMNVYTMLFLS